MGHDKSKGEIRERMVPLMAEEERRLDDCSADTTWLFTEAAGNLIIDLRSGMTSSLLENHHFHPFERSLG